MEILRNKGRMTRLLLLLEMATDMPKDQRSLAQSVGITPQAVSDYLSRMKKEGIVNIGSDGPRATIKGVDVLHHDLLSLKELVDSSIGKLEIIRSTDAVAGEKIRKGHPVFLMMKDGMLCAFNEGSGSMGTADRDALPGEMVPVSSLSGLVELQHGVLRLIEITPARCGGGTGTITKDDILKVSGVEGSDHRLSALDLEAIAMLDRSGLRCDLELPPPEGVIEPLTRGLDIIALGTPYSISTLMTHIERKALNIIVKRSRVDAGSCR